MQHLLYACVCEPMSINANDHQAMNYTTNNIHLFSSHTSSYDPATFQLENTLPLIEQKSPLPIESGGKMDEEKSSQSNSIATGSEQDKRQLDEEAEEVGDSSIQASTPFRRSKRSKKLPRRLHD